MKHARDPKTGIAACGQPAKLEDIVWWGEDVSCLHCRAIYADRARRAAS